MIRRAMVFGASGQLGVETVRVLEHRGFDVEGFERGQVDIADTESVASTIAGFRPDAVFNCAAFNQVDLAESEPVKAFMGNALGVRNLAVACRKWNAILVHFSTDYVFDGRAGRPYTEADATHPIGAYAVSKLAGELYAQAYMDSALVVRTSGVFGPAGVKTNRSNFVETMLRLAERGQTIRVVEDHVASPTYAPWLANRAVELAVRGESGVFHMGGGTPISWFDYARMIFAEAGLQPDLRATNESEYPTAARRPKFSALANVRMEALGLAPMPPLADAVKAYFAARAAYL